MKHDLNQQNYETWQRVARIYAGEELGEDDPNMRRFVRDQFCQRLSGIKVLEIGCGPGTDAARFAEQGLDVTATDYAQEFIAVVKARYPGLTTHVMDMTEPDLPLQSFDGIYGFGCFIHLPRSLADNTLLKLRNLLVPGGILCLQLMASAKGILDYRIENWAGDPDCSMLFTCYGREDMVERLTRAGYCDVDTIEIPPCIYDKLPRLVERGIQTYLCLARNPLLLPVTHPGHPSQEGI
ncbi:hypothetical protein BST81_25340 [Leptolyngbya sp. 'hensonii']|uniref:class I SAM-dependent methyltransferase n=1 Tax=Leptolyngbya sp. 'hensonii' TaxID=1922337 RepID=UPI00094FED57|nr:class I SAM-dependent methyltransferase [Leptolyngbya sp. 'hensonii']OLP15603.1 hypothetical protein BST81_25340 [Leptolyngbya sp. 'hensonii']